MADPAELQAKLKQLSDAYAAQLPEKLRQMAQVWQQLSASAWDDEGFKTLHRMAHGLSGSGKTFGFAALSVAARQLETYLHALIEKKQLLHPEQRKQLHSLLKELAHAASLHEGGDHVDVIAVAPCSPGAQVSRHVFVVEDDVELAAELKIQLSYFGYDVSVFHSTADFRAGLQQSDNGVVLMDINFPEDKLGGIHIMAELQKTRTAPLPVIFLSSHDELAVRLEAVRVGGTAYLVKPLNIGALIDKLDELTSNHVAAAYRVLIVDDSTSLAALYAATLEQAGLSVRVVNNPLEVMQPLLEFAPDLILIDMYMPGCSGMELAQVIRQMDAYVGIPIVFLSAETNLEKQLTAVGLGGDDFLTKPIEPQHLISAVNSRIRRSQLLRSFMVRDSLTGLLNHTAIKDQLAHELVRARRQGRPLTFAMIDIDHFKQVNDNYGHPVGDRVIKSLSRLLKQRLRENDLVGRYGGEEFAVILLDADGPTAITVLDGIRRDFAQLHHLAGEQDFFASFSCGIADSANHDDVSRMTDAADKALYQAKHGGRNQIKLADL